MRDTRSWQGMDYMEDICIGHMSMGAFLALLPKGTSKGVIYVLNDDSYFQVDMNESDFLRLIIPLPV
jgi:hypothetical protein